MGLVALFEWDLVAEIFGEAFWHHQRCDADHLWAGRIGWSLFRHQASPACEPCVRPQDRRQESDGQIDSSQSDQPIDDPRRNVGRPESLAEDLCDKIPLKESNEAPIQCADDNEDECKYI